MANFFDQFDEKPAASKGGNFFDQFDPPDEPGVAEDVAKSAAIGVPKGIMKLAGTAGDVRDMMASGASSLASQFGYDVSPETISKYARRVPLPLLQGPTSKEIRDTVEGATGPLYEPKTTAGEVAQTVGEFAPAAMAGPGGVVRRLITGAVVPGVTSETAGQLTKGTEAEPWARLIGAVAPGTLAAGAKGLVVSPRGGQARAAEVANLEAEGVRDLTAGQRTGSTPLQYLEQSLGDVTGAGTRKIERAQEQFTKAALRRAGEDAPRATADVIDGAFKRIGKQFDDVAARNVLHPDAAMGPQLRQAIDEYNGIVGPSNRAPIIQAYEQEIGHVLGMNKNTIPGEAYQSLRSRMERTARTAPSEVADAVRGMKNALDKAMERHLQRTNSPDLGAWQIARREYRNILPIERAVTGQGSDAALGLISPSALKSAVVNQGRRGYARGTNDLGRLARSGEAVMRPFPQSGTAPRSYMSSLVGAGGLGAIGTGIATANPLLLGAGLATVAGPPLASRALMSRPVQNWLARQGPRNYTPAVSSAASLFDMQ